MIDFDGQLLQEPRYPIVSTWERPPVSLGYILQGFEAIVTERRRENMERLLAALARQGTTVNRERGTFSGVTPNDEQLAELRMYRDLIKGT